VDFNFDLTLLGKWAAEGAAAVPFIMLIVDKIKVAFPNIEVRYYPLISWVVGIGLVTAFAVTTGQSPVTAIWIGAFAGFTTSKFAEYSRNRANDTSYAEIEEWRLDLRERERKLAEKTTIRGPINE
jgi:hypothetical protein